MFDDALQIDGCLMYLFGWKSNQIDPVFKIAAFHHLYSYTSVKSIVHWFQIIASQVRALLMI